MILLTGASGYVGSWLGAHLLADGHKVRGIDMELFGEPAQPDNDNYEFIKGDVREICADPEVWKDIDTVIYLASLSNNDMCNLNPVLDHDYNRLAIRDVQRFAKSKQIDRFIYASSVAAYGSSDTDATEDMPLRPTTLYGAGKAFGESVVLPHGGMVVRAASICGPSGKMRFDITLNKMTHDAIRHGAITLNGGWQKRCHVSLQDVCDFYRLLLKTPWSKLRGQVFNLVECNQSIIESANMVSEVTGAPTKIGSSTDNRSYTVSGIKAKEVLGFEPHHPVKHAVHHLAARLRAGYWKDSLTDPKLWNMRYDIA